MTIQMAPHSNGERMTINWWVRAGLLSLCFGFRGNAQAQCTAGDLSAQLDQIVQDPSLHGTNMGAMVADVETGMTIWALNPDRLLNPASTQKLLTLLAVLDALGPSQRITTSIHADGEIVDGVLDGDLYVQGGADPALEYPRWRKLVEDVYVAGIHQITGNLIIDNELLPPGPIPGWSGGNETYAGSPYEAPISALNINYNVIGLVISPGRNDGDPVIARLEIATDAVTINNQATTQSARTNLTLNRRQRGQQTELLLEGNVSNRSNSRWLYRSVANPIDYAGVTFREIYATRGGVLDGELRIGETPDDTEIIAATQSPPTSFLLSEMTKRSNNQMAEQLATVAAEATYGRSNRFAVRRLLMDTLENYGIDGQGAVILNASGLSRDARLSPRQLVQTTAVLNTHPQWRHEAMASMAIYGRDGTVRNRIQTSPAVDRVRAKTGSIHGVSAISGIAETLDNQTLAFTFMVNELPEDISVRPIWNQMVEAIVETCPLPQPHP